jgi:hypothetical protein
LALSSTRMQIPLGTIHDEAMEPSIEDKVLE